MQAQSIYVEDRLYPVLSLPGRPKALLDRTIAQIYGVETKHINQAVNRNPGKFPPDFYFDLTIDEAKTLNEVTNCDLAWKGGHLPKAFTHLGCNMLATILKSNLAEQRCVQIIRAFTALERIGQRSLQDFDEMMSLQYQMFAALNNTVEDMKGLFHKFADRLIRLEKRIMQLEGTHNGDNQTIISVNQAKILQQTAKEQAGSKTKIMQLWADFKREFAVNRYIHLPGNRFTEALAWIQSWRPSQR